MPRPARLAPGGYVYHVLNRANNRAQIFDTDDDYLSFLRVMRDALARKPMRILAYCLMPNHWHLLLWPMHDGELAAYLHAITSTHVRRWRLHRQSVGEGHVYQGTYKSFPVEGDDHFYSVCRYVERNAMRAGLVARAEEWRWGSLWQRLQPRLAELYPPLDHWPVPMPREWKKLVNEPQTDAEFDAIKTSIRRGRPFGSKSWQESTAKALRLEATLHARGRPRKMARAK